MEKRGIGIGFLFQTRDLDILGVAVERQLSGWLPGVSTRSFRLLGLRHALRV